MMQRFGSGSTTMGRIRIRYSEKLQDDRYIFNLLMPKEPKQKTAISKIWGKIFFRMLTTLKPMT